MVLDDVAFSRDVNFVKGPGGHSAVEGQFVSEAGAARGAGRLSGGKFYPGQVGLDGFERFTKAAPNMGLTGTCRVPSCIACRLPMRMPCCLTCTLS